MMFSKGQGKTFVMGDIHGAYRALRQCLERSEFDFQTDRLICLGDVCDGWPDTKMCIDELLKIQNLTYVLGNHDMCALQWMRSGESPPFVAIAARWRGHYSVLPFRVAAGPCPFAEKREPLLP